MKAHHRIGAFAVVAAFWFFGASSPGAIMVDPGPVGGRFNGFNDVTVTAGDLTGDAFDIEWTLMKHVEIFAGGEYGIGLFEWTDPVPIDYTVFLTDENGQEIPGTMISGTILDAFGNIGDRLIPVNDIVFHGMHYEIDGLANLGILPQTIRIAIGRTPSSPPTLVGEWGPAIPEPTTFAVWSLLGLTLTGACCWSRCRGDN